MSNENESDIFGLDFWNDRDRHYSQDNNPTDIQLYKDEVEEGGKIEGWLETCGPSMLTTLCHCAGYDVGIKTPGIYRPQPEETLADYFNDDRNYGKFKAIRDDLNFYVVQGNRVANLHALAVKEVFNANATFFLKRSYEDVIVDLLHRRGCGICLKDPGHYLAVVAYDRKTKELIYHDSHPGRTKTDGFALRMSEEEYRRNVQDCVTVVRSPDQQ